MFLNYSPIYSCEERIIIWLSGHSSCFFPRKQAGTKFFFSESIFFLRAIDQTEVSTKTNFTLMSLHGVVYSRNWHHILWCQRALSVPPISSSV